MPHIDNLVLGRGKLYFDRYLPNTTTKTGERYFGATASFGVTAESTDLPHYNSEESVKVKDESVTLQVDYTGTLMVENMSGANLALFLLGSSEQTTIAAAVGEVEEFTAGVGLFYQLGSTAAKPEGVEHVDNVVVTDDAVPTTTYVEGTDYTVDLDNGYVEVLEGGAIASGDTFTVTYDIVAQTQERVISAKDQIQGAMRFRSFNGAGAQRNIYMPKVTLRPSGEIALKGDEWQNASFNAEILQAGNLANVFATARAVRS